MSLIGNIIWLIFGGFFAGLGYIIGGIALCITIIGLPLGLKAIRFGFTVMSPFGKSVQPTDRGTGCLSTVFNVLWLLLFGWEIALIHIGFGVAFAVTIIGIPFAMQHFKLVPVALFPFSYKLGKVEVEL